MKTGCEDKLEYSNVILVYIPAVHVLMQGGKQDNFLLIRGILIFFPTHFGHESKLQVTEKSIIQVLFK